MTKSRQSAPSIDLFADDPIVSSPSPAATLEVIEEVKTTPQETTPPVPPQISTLVEFDKAVNATQLSIDGMKTLRESFAPHFAKFQSLATAAANIPADAPKAARAMRLELRAVRLAAEKTRKEQGEEALRRSKAVNGINNILLYALTPIEEAMEKIEKAEELAEAARKEALKTARSTEFLQFNKDTSFYNFAEMPEDVYQKLLEGTRVAYEAEIKAQEKAEADRLAKEKADKEEQDKIRAENERLRKEAADAKAARDRADAEAKAERDRLAADAQRKLNEERAKAKADADAAALIAKQAKDAADKIAKEERDARAKADAELAKVKAAEAKRIADEAAAKRKAAKAPEKQKVVAFAAAVRALPVPTLTSSEGIALAKVITQQIEKFARWADGEAEKL